MEVKKVSIAQMLDWNNNKKDNKKLDNNSKEESFVPNYNSSFAKLLRYKLTENNVVEK